MESFKFSNKVEQQAMMSLSVYNVGRQQCTAGYKWGPAVRDHYLIHYITSGKGTYTVEEKTYALSAGDAFLIYPDTRVSYQADLLYPWNYEWVGFNGSDARIILNATSFSRDHVVLSQPACGERLRAGIRRVYEAFGNSFSQSLKMTGQLYLLLELLTQEAGEDRRQKGRDADVVRAAVGFIDQRYSYAISVEDVAAFAGVSRSTLFRIFTRYLELSPKEYLDRYRIRKARYLLRDTDLTIGAIAVSVGYDNGLYFSKAFHKMTGQTPSQYRAGSHRAPEMEEAPRL